MRIRDGIDHAELTSDDVAITDSRYGRTLDIYACRRCGFRQCPPAPDLLALYENLQDQAYEQGRLQRAIQFRAILKHVRRATGLDPVGRTLLDVGAGSGILVEESLRLGWRVRGVEPSQWLQNVAAERGLPVLRGTVQSLAADIRADVATVIDVIEHVQDPADLLEACRARLHPGGYVVLVTPDCGSLTARVMGWRWWHYRLAHVGYFNRRTLHRLLRRTGFSPVYTARPSWWFPVEYLRHRLGNYLPNRLLPPLGGLDRLTVPLNLLDSLLVVARRREAGRRR